MENINKFYKPKMREEWIEMYASKRILQNSLLE